jgi:hypothetical protein
MTSDMAGQRASVEDGPDTESGFVMIQISHAGTR